jgi:Encapsulating protein for peroxidase
MYPNDMNGNLGRDKLWNESIWSEIDKAVQEEVGRIRMAQKVFPSTIVNNALPVCVTRAVPFGPGSVPPKSPGPDDDQFQPFFEISSGFVLTQAQVDGEENLRLAPSRARMAGSAVALAEDTILFLGQGSTPAGVNVTNKSAFPPGFIAETANYAPFTSVHGAGPDVLGNLLAALPVGMAALNARSQPGPYALFVSPERYAQSFAPPKGSLVAPGDQINHVITGGFYMVNSLTLGNLKTLSPPPDNPDLGILVSLGGEPAKIIIGTEATTAFAHTDTKGNYHFRVFERTQMVVQDGRAFQRLIFP